MTSELRSNVRSAEWDLEDLEESVRFRLLNFFFQILKIEISVVRNNPARFGLHIGELDARVAYIRQVKI